MATDKTDGLDQFRKWLVPFLMSALGILCGWIGSDIISNQVKANNEIEALKLLVANKPTGIEKDVANNTDAIKENKDNEAKLTEKLELHISANNEALYSEARKRLKYKF